MVRSNRFLLLLSILVYASIHSASFTGSRNDAFIGYTETFTSPWSSFKYPRVRPPKPQEYLIFTTEYGDINVHLLIESAPVAVQYIKRLVRRGLYDGCAFYRAEPAGDTVDTGKAGSRKGYALLQGGMFSCGRQQSDVLPIEPAVNNTMGAVSLITGTSEFFFNLEDHLEWNGSFTVWGKVVDNSSWEAIKRIVYLPTREELHPSGTILRILLKEVKFSVRLEHRTPP